MKVFFSTLLISITISIAYGFQQNPLVEAPENWFNLSPEESPIYGVATNRAYLEILKDKPTKTVIVAVIDSGVDHEHEDLKPNMWVNEGEIPGNGIDDDKNGYVDDIYGWNFIGGKDGEHVDHDTMELTRLYKKYQERFKDAKPESLSKDEKTEFELYTKLREKYEKKVSEAQQQYLAFSNFLMTYKKAKRLILAYLDIEELDSDALNSVKSPDEKVSNAQALLAFAGDNNLNEEEIEEGIEYFKDQLDYGYNLDFDPRSIVGDNEEDLSERYYGNPDVIGPDAGHGTHVAGIIAATRNNGKGIDGIATDVKIMALRAVPNGDERDKDIANAIYYAVDNGARVINMSFGKKYSPHKEIVDRAVKYGQAKGVLFVHAAGNDAENNDEIEHFPTRDYKDSRKSAKSWLEVGASSWKEGKEIPGDFSNYGKKSVDVFAPGVDINSTVPGQKYEVNSGTSMASPVAAGVAALLMSHYPELSAADIKEIIMDSVTPLKEEKVITPGADPESNEGIVNFGDLSVTGGVVNAYEAVKLAENHKKIRKK